MCDRKIRKSIPLFEWMILEFFIVTLTNAVFSTSALPLCLEAVYLKYGATVFRLLVMSVAILICLNGIHILHVILYALSKGADIYIIPFVHVRVLIAYLRWRIAVAEIRRTNAYATTIPVNDAIHAAKQFYYKDLLTYVENSHIIPRGRNK